MTEELSEKMENVDIKDSEEDKKRPDYLEWSEYFMAVSFLSAMRSKDPATQVFSLIFVINYIVAFCRLVPVLLTLRIE